ncbi:MAG: AbrB/MazE/SpoVT family DNA-binding domain-containing protein [Spongiibacteraceae bacterium]
MSMAKLTSKGQITLPIDVRTALGVVTGDRVEFVEENGRFIVIPATQDAKKLKGLIKRPSTPVSIEAMNAAIRKRGGAQ